MLKRGHQLRFLPPRATATAAASPARLAASCPSGLLLSDTVDSLNLGAFHARYAGGGSHNQPLHPAMMVKVLVYAYATGVFSSRKIAKKLHEDIAFRVLAAGNFPAHRTIRDFRAQHLGEFTELFTQVVRLARDWAGSCWAPSP